MQATPNFELEIKPTKGHFNKNYDTFGKMDPFIQVNFEKKSYKSDVATKQGQDPKWTKSIIVPVTLDQLHQDKNIVIQAYDEDAMSNDLIGEITYRLAQIQAFPQGPNVITLYDTTKKRNEVGWIEVIFQLREAAEPQPQSQKPTTQSTTKPKAVAPTSIPTKVAPPYNTNNTTELVIRNIRAHFNKDTDLIGKMDPFFVFTVEKPQVRTEVAKNAGTDPKWLESTTLYVTSQQIAQDQPLLIEAYDEDIGGSEYLGEATIKLSQTRSTPDFIKLPLYNKNDKKKLEIGWIAADFELKGGNAPKTSTQQYASNTSTNARNRSIGTFVVNPLDGRLDSVSDQQAVHLVFVHGETAYQTADSEGPGRKPVFKDLISFQQLEGENVIVRCFDNDLNRGGLIGEGIIPLANLPRNYRNPLRVELSNNGRRVGEINVNLDLFPEYTFKNPVKVYNSITINRGDYISKKIKYSNPDSYPKNLLVQSDNKNLVLVKTERLTIPAHSFGEIRFRITAPTNPSQSGQDVCCVNIVIEDSKVPEESLLFRIKSI
jgi:Ca2+-dependent lipid-binding protein